MKHTKGNDLVAPDLDDPQDLSNPPKEAQKSGGADSLREQIEFMLLNYEHVFSHLKHDDCFESQRAKEVVDKFLALFRTEIDRLADSLLDKAVALMNEDSAVLWDDVQAIFNEYKEKMR